MTEISDRLRAHIGNDHLRGCEGRQYACDCGYDAETERLLGVSAIEIERLRAALQEAARRLIANGDGYGANEATSALEPKPMRSNLGPGET